MDFWISQILGILVSISVLVSTQLRDIKAILVSQIVCNLLGGLSYIYVDGFSGSAVYFAAVLQSIVYFVLRIKDVKPPKWLAFVFLAVFLGCSAATYKAPQDIFAMVAAVICTVSLAQEKPSVYRLLMFSNGLLWGVYDVIVGAYGMILSHAITSGSALIGMVRLDFKKKSKQQKEIK